jgi:hypothetical protein
MFENLGDVRRYVRTGCLLTPTKVPLNLKINIYSNLELFSSILYVTRSICN